MKSKAEIITSLARSSGDRMLLAGLLDKERTCSERGYLTHTRFLDGNERALCMEAVRQCGAQAHTLFWGGYEDAERVICIFYPDYLDENSAKEQAPLALLRAHKRKGDCLAHRDYLGALMGLQIDRSVVGDILVHEDGADLFVLEEIENFITWNLNKAGRFPIEITREPIGAERRAAAVEKEGRGSVASPRLDSVLALVFGLPRTQALAHIGKGTVFINHIPCTKPDKQIFVGDLLTVRGMGRAQITAFDGESRKGRLFLQYKKTK